MNQHARRVLPGGLVVLLLGVLAGGCGATLGNVCEQKCYQTKAAEPRDFDDCIRRCKK